MKKYLQLYALFTLLVGFEYWALTFRPALSLLNYFQLHHLIDAQVKITTTPGRPLSLWLGWTGLGLMILMNVYSMRKRFGFMSSWGRLPDWLNFHIFCGLMGPTLIFFHCSLNVRGIVGISFWSMIVSLSSGIIGRYLYVQMNGKQVEFDQLSTQALDKLNLTFERRKMTMDAAQTASVLQKSLKFVGVPGEHQDPNPFAALASAMAGDLRLLFSDLTLPSTWPVTAKETVISYAINRRRSQMLEPFRRLMGYWHAFHFPFAVFMYFAAVIHIISSLIFLTPA